MGAYNPTSSGMVSINGKKYAITNLQSNDYWALTGLDGSFFKAGQRYFVNVENSAKVPLYPNVTLEQGAFYSWDGLQWIKEQVGLDTAEVDSRIIPGARAVSSDVIPSSRLGTPLTQAQFDALAVKKPQLYFIIN